jgi:hypothetical protein
MARITAWPIANLYGSCRIGVVLRFPKRAAFVELSMVLLPETPVVVGAFWPSGLIAAYPLLVENAVDDPELAAADFLVAVFGVEMLGADEDDGGVQVQ